MYVARYKCIYLHMYVDWYTYTCIYLHMYVARARTHALCMCMRAMGTLTHVYTYTCT